MRTDQFNVVLLVAVLGWLAAQILKTIFYAIKFKTFNFYIA